MKNRAITRNLLLGGASLAAMVFGSGLRGAQAQSLIVNNTTTAAVTVTPGQSFDFVLINNSTVTGNVTNSGSIGLPTINDVGLEIIGSTIGGGVINTSGATISATEVGIGVVNSTIGDGITNAGNIAVNADPLNFTSTNDVILGIAVSGTAVSTGIDNSGNINVTAFGTGAQPNATNTLAAVVGIGVLGQTDVAADINNSGDIYVTASYTAGGGTTAQARATGILVGNANPGNVGDVSITNDGNLGVYAYAGATNARAFARGIDVSVTSTGTDFDLDLLNTSNGDISIVAQASGGSNASATASYAINQAAFGGSNIGIDLTNNGSINISALANASWTSAYAYASVTYGVNQSGSGTGSPGDSVAVSLTNTSSLSLDINASAVAYGSTATAYGYIYGGIVQYAYNADEATVDLNNSGAIDIRAYGSAYATNAAATATGYVSYGVYQTAYTANGDVLSRSSLTNDGTLNINAEAFASGQTYADANATIYYGISQYAFYGADSSVDLTNNGTINIIADANAWAFTHASAYALVATAIYQSADGRSALGDVASASLTNTSDLSINIIANAIVPDTIPNGRAWEADATASVSNAISQYASDADETSVSLDNSGAINIIANAEAYATSDAYAFASVDDGIYQSADSANLEVSAEAMLTNDGDIEIAAYAFASATSGLANAEAYNYNAISQYAFYGDEATVSLLNNGTIDILAMATAIADTAADATATLRTAIYQSADGNNDPGSMASVSITNTSDLSLNIVAYASAQGTNASAYATINDAITQFASDADYAYATIDNSGTMNIIAEARAYGTSFAYAYASNNSAVYTQSATADTGGEEAISRISNSGTFNVDAIAYASATNGNATASAYNYYAFDGQYAYTAAHSEVIIENTGTLEVRALAMATGTSSADASAYLYNPISQDVSADGVAGDVAMATVSNTATFNFLATATARADDATASASVYYAIEMDSDNADEAYGLIANSGNMNIVARANAHGSTNAYAYAYNSEILDQDVTAANNDLLAMATITNDGTLNLDAFAWASATDTAGVASAWPWPRSPMTAS